MFAPSPLSEVGSVARRQLISRLHTVVHLHRHRQMAVVAAAIEVAIATTLPCQHEHGREVGNMHQDNNIVHITESDHARTEFSPWAVHQGLDRQHRMRHTELACVKVCHGASSSVIKTSRPRTWVVHVVVGTAQGAAHRGPPQSTPSSLPLRTPSLHVAIAPGRNTQDAVALRPTWAKFAAHALQELPE
jgi:hypothetical protein